MIDHDDATLTDPEDFAEGEHAPAPEPAAEAPAKRIILHAKLARRVERGHLWVFSNEVHSEQGDPLPGDEVAVYDHKRRCVGMGLYSRSSLIRARRYSRRRGQPMDAALIRERLEAALAFRQAARPAGAPAPRAYRLVNSEADGLPGAVVDVFGDHVVIQLTTAGMDQRREALVEAIHALLDPACIIERSDLPVRALEGLPEVKQVLHGEPRTPLRIEEDGAVMLADLLEGQKTGYYLDQAGNRARLKPLVAGRRVLDLFAYVGAWAYAAAAGGAGEVLAIDSSAPALDLAEQARALNGEAAGRVTFRKADVFAALRELAAAGERFDVVVLDPPPLAKSKRDVKNALRGYRELNLRAMQLLAPTGLLVTCCCSHAVSEAEFDQVVGMAAKDARCDFSVLARPTQPADHPVHLLTPETQYLKTLFLARRDW